MKKNVLLNFFVQIITYLTPFILSPYLSRVLMPSGIGEYSFGNSIAYYFSIIIIFGFTNYGTKKISSNRQNKKEYSHHFWSIFFARLIFGLLSIFSYVLLLNLNLFSDKIHQYIYYSLILLLVADIMDISYLFQGLEEFSIASISNLVVNIGYMMLVFFLVKTEEDLFIYSFLKSGIKLAYSLILWCFAWKKLNAPVINYRSVLQVFKNSFLFFLPGLVMTLNQSLDILMLGSLSNTCETGYYEQVHKIVALVCSLIYAIGPILLSRISFLYSIKDEEEIKKKVAKLFRFTLLIILPACIGLYIIAPIFVPLYFGNDFIPAIDVMYCFIPEILFSCVSSIIINSYFYPTGNTSKCTIVVSFTTILNFLLNLWFIKNLGAMGAALASSISGFMQLVLLLIFSIKKVDYLFILRGSWKIVFSSILMGALTFFINRLLLLTNLNYFYVTIIDILCGGLFYFCFCILFKEEFLKESVTIIINKIKKLLRKE